MPNELFGAFDSSSLYANIRAVRMLSASSQVHAGDWDGADCDSLSESRLETSSGFWLRSD